MPRKGYRALSMKSETADEFCGAKEFWGIEQVDGKPKKMTSDEFMQVVLDYYLNHHCPQCGVEVNGTHQC